jgi:hypothetical protein
MVLKYMSKEKWCCYLAYKNSPNHSTVKLRFHSRVDPHLPTLVRLVFVCSYCLILSTNLNKHEMFVLNTTKCRKNIILKLELCGPETLYIRKNCVKQHYIIMCGTDLFILNWNKIVFKTVFCIGFKNILYELWQKVARPFGQYSSVSRIKIKICWVRVRP